MPPWNATKTKIQLRIAVQRLRVLQDKKGAQLKAARREIANLLEIRKVEKARVKVETIINDDIHVELLELLELYCELLIARFGLLDQNNAREPDPGISEGICAIIRCAPHTELKELHLLRDMLMHKYGRDFAVTVMENKDGRVPDRVMKKLTYVTPSSDLVDAYIFEIAKGYGVDWTPPNAVNVSDAEKGVGGEDSVKSSIEVPKLLRTDPFVREAQEPKLPDLPPTEESTTPSTTVTVGNEKPKFEQQLPLLPSAPSKQETVPSTTWKPPPPPPSEDDEFAVLARRFEALKRK